MHARWQFQWVTGTNTDCTIITCLPACNRSWGILKHTFCTFYPQRYEVGCTHFVQFASLVLYFGYNTCWLYVLYKGVRPYSSAFLLGWNLGLQQHRVSFFKYKQQMLVPLLLALQVLFGHLFIIIFQSELNVFVGFFPVQYCLLYLRSTDLILRDLFTIQGVCHRQ